MNITLVSRNFVAHNTVETPPVKTRRYVHMYWDILCEARGFSDLQYLKKGREAFLCIC